MCSKLHTETSAICHIGVRSPALCSRARKRLAAAEWLTITTFAGLLALGIVSILRMRTSSLAAPLATLCFVMFAWNFSVWAYAVSGSWVWIYVDRAFSPWTAPTAALFVLEFVGRRRSMKHVMSAFNAAAAVLGAVSASAFFGEWGRRAAVSAAWDDALAVVGMLYLVLTTVLLANHLARHGSAEEKMRTRLILAANVGSTLPEIAELLLHVHFPVPSQIVTVILMTFATFGAQLFDSELAGLGAIYAAAVTAIAAFAAFIAFRVLSYDRNLVALALFAIFVCATGLITQTWSVIASQRERSRRLMTVGMFAAQMAHDFKNPLAALKGAAQFLAEERAQGRSIDEQQEFVDMLVAESDRLSRLVDRYLRIGRLEATCKPVAVNELVRSVLRSHRINAHPGVVERCELGAAVGDCNLDADMMATALENLVRNAAEAMGDGGTLRVATELLRSRGGRETLCISVEDTGPGMDARQASRAFDEFFSTKPSGTGLGLPFVRRVAEAHHGTVKLRSRLGRGTRVDLLIPAVPADAD